MKSSCVFFFGIDAYTVKLHNKWQATQCVCVYLISCDMRTPSTWPLTLHMPPLLSPSTSDICRWLNQTPQTLLHSVMTTAYWCKVCIWHMSKVKNENNKIKKFGGKSKKEVIKIIFKYISQTFDLVRQLNFTTYTRKRTIIVFTF